MDKQQNVFSVKVVGIGGGGTNAVNRMLECGLDGVDFCVVNTDMQALSMSPVSEKVQIGISVTAGLGTGADPLKGKQAAEEDAARLQEIIKGYDILFLVAGFGGGTGTGAVPVIARIAAQMGILTVAVITKPFSFEGKRRAKIADTGIKELQQYVNTYLYVPNDKLLDLSGGKAGMTDAFKATDYIIGQAVSSISKIMNRPWLINVDYAALKTIMSEKGNAVIGFGSSEGQHKAKGAMKQAIDSPLMEVSALSSARGILICVTAGEDVSLPDINAAVSMVSDKAHYDANIIFGVTVDPVLNEKAEVTLIATGLSVNVLEKEVQAEFCDTLPAVPVSKRVKTDQRETPNLGFFYDVEPTVYSGENLDIPTFMRRRKQTPG